MNTRTHAHGRWGEILRALGVGPRFLANRHGPCPICGGKDRFRFDDRHGAGDYFCNQCGAGDGITLLMKLHGWRFKQACDEVDHIIGMDSPPNPSPPKQRKKSASPSNIERMLDEADAQSVVRRYLTSRGLSNMPECLRGHSSLPYFEDGRLICRCPAMVAPVYGPDGRLLAVHRTYLGQHEHRKKLTRTLDKLTGGAVRLFAPTDELGVAEGIETAIAVHELFNVPTWALVSTSLMEQWSPPDGVTRVLIFADNDFNFAGQKAAYTLANRLVRSIETVEVIVPDEPGRDWLDHLAEGRVQSA